MMYARARLILVSAIALTSALPRIASAQDAPPPRSAPPAAPSTALPPADPHVEVITTKLPESPDNVPASVEVITGDELVSRGATTLRDALSLAAGVIVAPGGDGGPAGAVPEFWGLRQFDAFLLVVDGVPWGAAFSPAVTTLSLRDVERIEILRGAAPVTYGATSFVGVIHVVHKTTSADRGDLQIHGGGYKSGGASTDLPLQTVSGWRPRLSIDFDREGFADDRTSFARGHALFRAVRPDPRRTMWVTADLDLLRQDPASPLPISGSALSTLVPVDANANPAGAFLNDNRLALSWGMEQSLQRGVKWSTTASFSHSSQRDLRGFLTTVDNAPDNATGLSEHIDLTEIYLDSHVVWPTRNHVRVVLGGDFLHGEGHSAGATFSYTAPLDGSSAPVVADPTALTLGNDDRREFGGAYGLVEWQATPRLDVTAGLRANVTFESRDNRFAGGAADTETHAQPSGNVGVMYHAWERGSDFVRVFGNYTGTFKPAAFDFSLGDETVAGSGGMLLDPETAQSLEAGMKSRALNGRLDVSASLFRMDFRNLVTATTVGGLPALQNSGKTEFEGVDVAASVRLPRAMSARASYSRHNGQYLDFTTTIDGVLTNLAGHRFEMSPRQLLSAGFVLSPPRGFIASVVVNVTGNRFLDAANLALSPGFATIDAGGGYRLDAMELRLDVRNIGNRRDPIAVSDLGDGQVYLMTARTFLASMVMKF